MRISEKQLTNFQELYKQHFGKEIGRDEALEKGIKLATLIKLICEPKDTDSPII